MESRAVPERVDRFPQIGDWQLSSMISRVSRVVEGTHTQTGVHLAAAPQAHALHRRAQQDRPLLRLETEGLHLHPYTRSIDERLDIFTFSSLESSGVQNGPFYLMCEAKRPVRSICEE